MIYYGQGKVRHSANLTNPTNELPTLDIFGPTSVYFIQTFFSSLEYLLKKKVVCLFREFLRLGKFCKYFCFF